jgi:hypothetical protein
MRKVSIYRAVSDMHQVTPLKLCPESVRDIVRAQRSKKHLREKSTDAVPERARLVEARPREDGYSPIDPLFTPDFRFLAA